MEFNHSVPHCPSHEMTVIFKMSIVDTVIDKESVGGVHVQFMGNWVGGCCVFSSISYFQTNSGFVLFCFIREVLISNQKFWQSGAGSFTVVCSYVAAILYLRWKVLTTFSQ